ncbi:MAG: GFA family protein [Pseudolabrys sp.]|nr:GFA family protein [Pseudolabrys sp.]
MPTWKLPMTGGCRCGKVRISIDSAPLLTMACHCTGCQRMSSSAFSLSAAVPNEGFSVTEGETVIGGLHGEARHYFCPYCMSWMFTRMEALGPFVNVRAGMLDEPAWFTPFMETYTSEKLPWATTPAVHSYPKFPEMDEYEGLMKEFAERA